MKFEKSEAYPNLSVEVIKAIELLKTNNEKRRKENPSMRIWGCSKII